MGLNKILNNKTLPLFSIAIFYITLYTAIYIRGENKLSSLDFLYYGGYYLPSCIVFIITLYLFNIFESFNINLNNKDIKSVFYSSFIYIIFNILYFYLFPSTISPKTILLIHGGLLFAFFSLFFLYYKNIILNKKKINAIMISDRIEAKEIVRKVAISKSNINFALHFDSPSFRENITEIDNLYKMITTHKVNTVVIDFDKDGSKEILSSIYHHYYNKIKVYSLNDFYEIIFKKIIYIDIDYNWYYKSATLDTFFYYITKRIIDIILSIPVLLILCIIHPIVYFKIKREMSNGKMNKGSIFYKHKRIGKNCKPFTVYQYRSMKYADEKQKWPGEENNLNTVTPYGEILRRTRIDTLPQVWNVLKGEQSFIGPRPDAEGLYAKLVKEIPYYNLRYSVTPGLSGWAQTTQKVVPHNIEDNKERFAYDLFYVKNKSILLDILIIIKTIKIIIMRAGK